MESSAELIPLPTDQRQFGRYRLLYRIAQGGMAAVYLARFTGPDGFEKLVAIKRIHPHLSEQENFVKMFKDEARLAARIAHPNVAQVIELGQFNNSYFIAMEYVEGENLTGVLKRMRIPITVGVRIMADALAGLHAAHELRGSTGELAELVHRDLSPSNILIAYDGAVKVVDFGVARARGCLHVTDVKAFKGKFAYMSPEQAAAEPVDRRSDIFAIGILLYESTTYSRLFRADNPGTTIDMIVNCDKLKRPSQIVPGYPYKLEQVVMRALRRNPKQRFQTAREMQLALEDYIYAAGAPLPATIVGDLMHSSFPDRIELKAKTLKAADSDSSVLAELDPEQSYSSVTFDPPEVIAPISTLDAAPKGDPAAAAAKSAGTPAAPKSDPAAVAAKSDQAIVEEPVTGPPALPPPPDTPYDPDGGPRSSHSMPAVGAPVAGQEIVDILQLDGVRRRRRIIVIGVSSAVVLGALAAFLLLRDRGGGEVKPPGPAIELLITATPASAVIRVNGQVVSNPYRLRRPAGAAPGEAIVQVSAPGHRTRELKLSTATSGERKIALEPLPAAAPDARGAPPDTSPAPAADVRPAVDRSRRVHKVVVPPKKGGKKGGKKGLFGNPYDD